jgi:hypothetical protein
MSQGCVSRIQGQKKPFSHLVTPFTPTGVLPMDSSARLAQDAMTTQTNLKMDGAIRFEPCFL